MHLNVLFDLCLFAHFSFDFCFEFDYHVIALQNVYICILHHKWLM